MTGQSPINDILRNIQYQNNVLLVGNEKGGVGKTLYSWYLAETAVRAGLRVLAVDTDGQMNFTKRSIGVDEQNHGNGVTYQVPPVHPDYDPNDPEAEERPSVAGFILGEYVYPYKSWLRDVLFEDRVGKLEVIASHGYKLEQAQSMFSNKRGEVASKVYNSLIEVLQGDYVNENYDLVIIDTPPTRTVMSRAAYRAATHVLTPSTFTDDDVSGIKSVQSAINFEKIHRVSHNIDKDTIKFIGILPTKIDRRKGRDSRIGYEEYKDKLGSILPTTCISPENDLDRKILRGKHDEISAFDVNKRNRGEYRFMCHLKASCNYTLANVFKDSHPEYAELFMKQYQEVEQEILDNGWDEWGE